jgi:FkbM family methyltransferase
MSKVKRRGTALIIWAVAAGLALNAGFYNMQVSEFFRLSRQELVNTRSPLEAVKGQGVECRECFPLISEFGRRCSSEEIAFNARKRPQSKSNCPQNIMYMLALLEHNELAEASAIERERTPVIVRVGCNKGDDFVLSLRQWSKNTSYSVTELYENHRNLSLGYACGESDETMSDIIQKELHSIAPGTARPVRGYCIEPMESTFGMLTNVFDTLGYRPPDVSLIHAAVSNYPGTADFPNSRPGVEGLGLQNASPRNSVKVKVITLNGLVQQENIKKIDYLSIDTEGHDMQVILGGIRIFAAHIVRYFEFEYHNIGRWSTSSLQDLVELLDQFRYDCYWALNTGDLVRLTGCWHDDYHQKRWSNVACISRNENFTSQVMESLTEFNQRG